MQLTIETLSGQKGRSFTVDILAEYEVTRGGRSHSPEYLVVAGPKTTVKAFLVNYLNRQPAKEGRNTYKIKSKKGVGVDKQEIGNILVAAIYDKALFELESSTNAEEKEAEESIEFATGFSLAWFDQQECKNSLAAVMGQVLYRYLDQRLYIPLLASSEFLADMVLHATQNQWLYTKLSPAVYRREDLKEQVNALMAKGINPHLRNCVDLHKVGFDCFMHFRAPKDQFEELISEMVCEHLGVK